MRPPAQDGPHLPRVGDQGDAQRRGTQFLRVLKNFFGDFRIIEVHNERVELLLLHPGQGRLRIAGAVHGDVESGQDAA